MNGESNRRCPLRARAIELALRGGLAEGEGEQVILRLESAGVVERRGDTLAYGSEVATAPDAVAERLGTAGAARTDRARHLADRAAYRRDVDVPTPQTSPPLPDLDRAEAVVREVFGTENVEVVEEMSAPRA